MVSNYGYIFFFQQFLIKVKKLTKFWPKDKLYVQARGLVQSKFQQKFTLSLAPAPGFICSAP